LETIILIKQLFHPYQQKLQDGTASLSPWTTSLNFSRASGIAERILSQSATGHGWVFAQVPFSRLHNITSDNASTVGLLDADHTLKSCITRQLDTAVSYPVQTAG
jgi:hypothetical protein